LLNDKTTRQDEFVYVIVNVIIYNKEYQDGKILFRKANKHYYCVSFHYLQK